MSEHSGQGGNVCQGPHLACDGCCGAGQTDQSTMAVDQYGQVVSAVSAHRCRHCAGRGFYCKATPKCDAPHNGQTFMIRPRLLPPV